MTSIHWRFVACKNKNRMFLFWFFLLFWQKQSNFSAVDLIGFHKFRTFLNRESNMCISMFLMRSLTMSREWFEIDNSSELWQLREEKQREKKHDIESCQALCHPTFYLYILKRAQRFNTIQVPFSQLICCILSLSLQNALFVVYYPINQTLMSQYLWSPNEFTAHFRQQSLKD